MRNPKSFLIGWMAVGSLVICDGGETLRAASDYDTAYALEVKGNYAGAIGGYGVVMRDLSRRDLWAQAAFHRADCQWHLEKYGEAFGAFREVVAKFPNDPLARQAQVRIMIIQSGPLNSSRDAIAAAQFLARTWPTTDEGEQGAYSVGLLNYWAKNVPAARDALRRYLRDYPHGRFTQASNELLKEMESGK